MLKSERLSLHPLHQEDVDDLYFLMSNAEAMKFTCVAPSVQECAKRLHAYEDMRSTLGFAPWVLRTRKNESVVGWGSLSIDPNEPKWGLEVSYAFRPEYWGEGLATELVRFSLLYAFMTLGAKEVSALAMEANTLSTNVLKKCGFQLLRYENALLRNHFRASVASAA